MTRDPKAKAGAAIWEQKTASRPVDLVHLSRYTLGDRALEREVLELFCTQSFICLSQLMSVRSDTDWREAAHSLKGSARAIGAWPVAEYAERAEALEGAALAAVRAQLVGEIEVALHETKAYILSLLADTEAASALR